jgi:uncharacterized membrane protein (DUF106 family)
VKKEVVFDAILNPIFSPLLKIDPLLAIIIISVFMSGLITLAYKFLTDQNEMKRLKTEIKEHQKKMRKLRDDPNKMMKAQKEAMEVNSRYMMLSLKPTLFTFIPIIIIFGWLNSHMAFYPIVAGEDFNVTATFVEGTTGQMEIVLPTGITAEGDTLVSIEDDIAVWMLNAPAGEYSLEYKYDGKEFSQDLIVTESIDDRRYAKPEFQQKELPELKGSSLLNVKIGNEKIKPFQKYPILKSIPWFGGFGWLGTYIVLSIISSMLIRKIFKVY